ncbi:hypothetical protein CLAIMM_14957 isoform 2 [Cladophialophora immunda]|nr:hypothetical protein CLAIMM_14957 isoform 2 [Cladophialophora immunda]
MDSISDNALEPGALRQPFGSLSVSDGGGGTGAQHPPSLSSLPPPTEPDQLQEALKFAEDFASGKLRLRVDSDPIEFTISRESWFKLQQDSHFDLCTECKSFRFAYDSSRSLLTIMPPPSTRHDAVVEFLSDLAQEAKFNLMSPAKSKMSITWNRHVRDFEKEYESSQKQPDLSIKWYENDPVGQLHTVVEVGVSQSLQSLRALVPLYLQGKPEVQRVILVKIKETPVFRSSTQPSTDTSLTPDSKELRRDEATGVIWFGDVKVVGETQMLWEVWGRNIDGDPHKIFEETMTYGAVPSRDLPFFTIPEGGTQGDPEVTVGREEMEEFWGVRWFRGSWADASRRAQNLTV